MAPLQKQDIQVKFGAADQFRNKKYLLPGKLVDAINVRQANEFILGKRFGYSALDRVADVGSITAAQALGSDGNALAMLADKTIWSRSDARAKWDTRGGAERVTTIPTVAINGTGLTKSAIGYAPTSGGNGYFYIASEDHSTGGGPYKFKIVDAVTGTVITEGSGPAGSHTDLRWARLSASKYMLFYKTAAQKIVADIFDPTNVTTAATTVTIADFASGGGTSLLEVYDVVETTSGLVVFAFAINGTVVLPTPNSVAWATISTVTGLPGAWGGLVTGALSVPCAAARENGSSGFLYALYTLGGNLIARKMDVGTFANQVATTLLAVAGGTSTAVTGHREAGGNLVVWYSQPGAASNPETGFTTRVVMTPAFAVTSDARIHGNVLVSTSFSLSMTVQNYYAAGQPWYVATMHDDNVGQQRTYHVRDSSSRIVARSLYGRAGPFGGNFITMPCVPPSPNARVVMGLAVNSASLTDFAACRFDVDLAPTCSRPVAFKGGARLAWPGGWPVRAGGAELVVSEVSPTMFPRAVTTATAGITPPGLPVGTYQVAATYVQYDADGNPYQSAPSPIVSQAVAGANTTVNVTVPTYRVTNGAPTFIALWATIHNATTPYLYTIVPNDTTVDAVVISLNNLEPAVDEILYTFGGELANDPAPPARFAFEWQGRLFLGGTDVRGEMWPSKEYVFDRGLEFSLGTRFTVGAGTGDLTMGCALDDNYALIFRADAIFSITGKGPTSIGQGNYDPVCFESGDGTTRPGSVVRGPAGVYYQGNDGGIWLVTHGRQRMYVGAGCETYAKAANITAAVHLPTKNEIRFFTDTGKILAFDYAMPDADRPEVGGQWYVRSSSNLQAAVGACLHKGVQHHIETDGTVRAEVDGQYYDGNTIGAGTSILPSITVAPFAFAGPLSISRVYKGQFLAEFKSQHTIRVTATRDYGAAVQAFADRAVAAGPEVLEFRLDRQQLAALELKLEQISETVVGGEGFTFEGLAFEVGLKRGLRRVAATNRL